MDTDPARACSAPQLTSTRIALQQSSLLPFHSSGWFTTLQQSSFFHALLLHPANHPRPRPSNLVPAELGTWPSRLLSCSGPLLLSHSRLSPASCIHPGQYYTTFPLVTSSSRYPHHSTESLLDFALPFSALPLFYYSFFPLLYFIIIIIIFFLFCPFIPSHSYFLSVNRLNS